MSDAVIMAPGEVLQMFGVALPEVLSASVVPVSVPAPDKSSPLADKDLPEEK